MIFGIQDISTDEFLDLGEFSIDMVFTNPLFQTDLIPKVLTYPFSIPASPRNKQLLRFSHRLDAGHNPTAIDVRIMLFGQLWFLAQLRIESAGTVFEIVVEQQPGGLPANFGEQSLRDVAAETLFMSTQKKVIILTYESLTFGGTSSSVTLTVNDITFSATGHANLSDALDDLIAQNNTDTVATKAVATRIGLDQIRLTSIGVGARDWFDHTQTRDGSGVLGLGFTEVDISEAWITTHQANLLAFMDATVPETWPSQKLIFYPVKNTGFYSEGNHPGFGGYLNFYDNPADTFESNFVDFNTKVASARSITPFPYVYGVLEKIFTQYGIGLAGPVWEDTELRSLTFYNNRALDAHDYVYGTNGNIVEPINLWDPEIRIQDHVPDITVAELLVDFRKLFNTGFFLNEREGKMILRTAQDILDSDEIRDLDPYIAGQFPVLYDLFEGITFSSEQDPEDNLIKERPEELTDYIIPLGREKITSGTATLLMLLRDVQRAAALPVTWKIPAAKQPGASLYFSQGLQEATSRFLFYRGLQPESGAAHDYPLGSHDTTNRNGDPTGTYSLDWNGAAGLYDTWWKGWAEMLARARGGDIPIRVDPGMLVNYLDFFTSKWRVENSHVLIREVSVQITAGGIGEATAATVKI